LAGYKFKLVHGYKAVLKKFVGKICTWEEFYGVVSKQNDRVKDDW
jgi:hypothetical protein